MCQAKPGPRCAADTKPKLEKHQAKLDRVAKSVEVSKAKQTAAMQAGDFTAYARARKQTDALEAKLSTLTTETQHVLRDYDGTKTGSRELSQQMVETVDNNEYQALDIRRGSAHCLYVVREHALGMITEGTPPQRGILTNKSDYESLAKFRESRQARMAVAA